MNGVAATHPTVTMTIEAAKTQKPSQESSLRLRNETQLGFKQVKWIKGIEFVADYAEVGGGHGGYNQDHEFFGYRQSI